MAYMICNSFVTYQESADIKLETAAGLSGIKGISEESN